MNSLNKIKTYKSKIIDLKNGNIYKMLNKNSKFYRGFGEIYFSGIKYNKVKAWKIHKKMRMNLIVPFGSVKFVFCNDKQKPFKEIIIGSKKNEYKIIVIPPKIWFGFKGYHKPYSLVCNFSNIVHDPSEVESCDIKDINYEW